MKTTINQLRTFYNNHPLTPALKRAEKIYFEVYEFGKYEEMIKIYSRLEIKAAYNRKNALRMQISKDVHRRFKDLERYLNINSLYHKYNLPKVKIFNKYEPYYSLQIGLNGDTYLEIRNPLEHNNNIIIKNQIQNIDQVPKLVKKEFKKLFFAKGKGKYGRMQIEYNLSKTQLLEKIETAKQYKKSSYYDHEADEFDFLATLKSLKRNLGLIFNENASMFFITEAVNKIGRANKGKTPKPVFKFDTSNIDISGTFKEVETQAIEEFNKQSYNTILI